MEIKQTNRFKKIYKKLHSNQINEVNDAIKEVIENPTIGEQKKETCHGCEFINLKCLDS